MARNIEIKAKVEDFDQTLARTFTIADEEVGLMEQDDCFFHCDHGRFKLRDFGANKGELIFYRRVDQVGPKISRYQISPVEDCASMRELLGEAHGLIGRVKKRRMVFMFGRTRIHLDRVEDLGNFLELEVVLREGEADDDGRAEAAQLMKDLGVRSEDLIEGAYLDLLKAR